MENLYHQIFRAFEAAGVQYLVVGGVAVNLHGYARFTGDLDILLALDLKNLQKVASIMGDMGFMNRLPIELTDLAKEDQVRKWLTEKNMTAFAFISDRLPQFSLDVLAAESLRFSELEGRKVVKCASGITIPVVSIDDVVGMKRAANREKDLEDIEALLELKGL